MDDFDPSTRREMETFLAREQANAKLQHTIQTLTTTCICVTSTPSNKFSSAEASCLTATLERFMDTSMFLIKSLSEKQRSH
ncbi:hypothetical protein BDZ89DRAFT_946497 [Hymenopellis radicata]|nr:hypothetical protein BDZ89DRAFT_946497 [Hymenopellis radicata]